MDMKDIPRSHRWGPTTASLTTQSHPPPLPTLPKSTFKIKTNVKSNIKIKLETNTNIQNEHRNHLHYQLNSLSVKYQHQHHNHCHQSLSIPTTVSNAPRGRRWGPTRASPITKSHPPAPLAALTAGCRRRSSSGGRCHRGHKTSCASKQQQQQQQHL